MAAAQRLVGHGRRCRRVPDRALARQRHRQRLRAGADQPERPGHRPRAVVGRGRVDGRHRVPELPAGQDARVRALTGTTPTQLGALLPHDRGPQGGRLAVRGRCPALPLHRRSPRHAHPHRAAQPDQSRLRPRHLHRAGGRARHDHDDDGVVGRRRAARQLAGPLDDRLPAHGLPPRGGLLVLDLHGRLPGDPRARCSSVASRPAGPGTHRCRPRRSGAWTPISSGSR